MHVALGFISIIDFRLFYIINLTDYKSQNEKYRRSVTKKHIHGLTIQNIRSVRQRLIQHIDIHIKIQRRHK